MFITFLWDFVGFCLDRKKRAKKKKTQRRSKHWKWQTFDVLYKQNRNSIEQNFFSAQKKKHQKWNKNKIKVNAKCVGSCGITIALNVNEEYYISVFFTTNGSNNNFLDYAISPQQNGYLGKGNHFYLKKEHSFFFVCFIF